jgi:hypothetical protein
MAGTYYKYAERDADSQINWAEVGKGLSDMLSETNRVREEKKAALDEAQRETMKYLAETPNGEHTGARTSILNYADTASNTLRLADQQLKSGQLSPKDYMILRQNIIDGTNLAFNANKSYQENWSLTKERERDGISSGLEPENWAEVEGFGDWGNIGWHIAPDGTVMAGKMVEEEIDGKKVRTLDKTPGGLRSMDYLNQAILGRIDRYDYQSKVKGFVDNLGKEKKVTVALGRVGAQGLSKSIDDITRRTDLDPETKQILFDFKKAEDEKVKEIAGTNLDSARILFDSAITAPNMQPYKITTDPSEAKKGNNYILKVVDPSSGGFTYQLTEAQKKDAQEFVRANMRAQYNYEEDAQVVGQLDETAAAKARAAYMYGSGDKDTPPPVQGGEILVVKGTDSKGNKVPTGVSQKLKNAVIKEIAGIENEITDIGYNNKTGALEIVGYQSSGETSSGVETDINDKTEEGKKSKKIGTGKKGSKVAKKIAFRGNSDINAGLMSAIITEIPNPSSKEGYNFRDIAEAKAYYKGEYLKARGNSGNSGVNYIVK